MNHFFRFSLLTIALTTSIATAQQSAIYTHDLQYFEKAEALYKDKQYQSAQIIFEKVKETTTNTEVQADCAYYVANCAVRLNQLGADAMVEKFVEDYPTSSKQNQAYIEVAHYYFDQGSYPKALEWFNKADVSSMSSEEKERYNFQKGYAYFTVKNKKEAKNI